MKSPPGERIAAHEPFRTASPEASRLAVVQTRILSVDLLRGLVMVLMALDHVRDFSSNAPFNPLDLAHTTPALFFTRWVTHFCAPAFVFLAGLGAFLYGARVHPRAKVARFLMTRGAFLIVLEFTLVHFGWFFSFEYHFLLAQVIWMLGWSMVALAAMVSLPRPAIAAIGITMIFGHNLLDRIDPESFGSFAWSWTVLHSGGTIMVAPDRQLFVLYPLIPWIGVIAVGYAVGPLFLREPEERRRWLVPVGLGLTLGFVLLRALNSYGDPMPWSPGPDAPLTLLSFINTEKYPPSLLFLLMTLGPCLLALALFDRPAAQWARPLIVFGRVPLFYYVVHLVLIHAAALAFSYLHYGEADWLFGTGWMFRRGLPDGYGYSLPVVYLIWLATITALYPACRWFARLKERRRGAWLSYL